MSRDTGIADRLRAAGLKVVEVDGWRTRGSDSFSPRGSVDHHTAGGRSGNAPSLGICINGRSDLPGPLCNVLIGRDNTCFVVAAGRANHAGKGAWQGRSGNSSVYGVERENVGTSAEPWRDDQTDAAARCHAALVRGHSTADGVCEHKEWAPQRKVDAHTVTGATMRRLVDAVLSHTAPEEPDMTGEEHNKLVNVETRVTSVEGHVKHFQDIFDTWEPILLEIQERVAGATGGAAVDLDALAEKVAEKLAARLQD